MATLSGLVANARALALEKGKHVDAEHGLTREQKQARNKALFRLENTLCFSNGKKATLENKEPIKALLSEFEFADNGNDYIVDLYATTDFKLLKRAFAFIEHEFFTSGVLKYSEQVKHIRETILDVVKE